MKNYKYNQETGKIEEHKNKYVKLDETKFLTSDLVACVETMIYNVEDDFYFNGNIINLAKTLYMYCEEISCLVFEEFKLNSKISSGNIIKLFNDNVYLIASDLKLKEKQNGTRLY